MARNIGLVLLSLAAIGIAGCGKNSATRMGMQSQPNVAAPASIKQAFAISNADPASLTVSLNNSRTQISILKSALEKEFLMQGSLILGGNTTSFHSMRSRIVAFREKDGKLYLLEASKGHTVSKELPMNLLLAEFPILNENDASITFDFNAGMSNILTDGDWYAADSSQSRTHKLTYTALKTKFSYIDSASLNDRNQLAIRQVAQIAVDGSGRFSAKTIEVQYYLNPYQPSAGFTPTEAVDQEVAGFFAIDPILNAGGSTNVRASKFDLSKPIVYAVSSNTPPEFREAVKQGVLYWNGVFGEERLKVVDAPAGIFAPDINYNVIQWIDDTTAGAAYADAQMDPRSGETLHAQIFLASVFAESGRQWHRKLTRREKPQTIQLAGFENSVLCDFDLDLDAIPDSVKTLKAAQDYVRFVTAHEVGHTLGLRHNFGGSTAASYTLAERRDIFSAYLKTGSAPKGTVIGSSVMDYYPFQEDAMAGDQMSRGGEFVGAYDLKAIDILYKGKRYKASEVPFFCTDDQAEAYADCRRFDLGASPIEYSVWEQQEAFSTLPYSFAETFIRQVKSPSPDTLAIPVDKVSPNPDEVAASLFAGRTELYSYLTAKAKFLKIRRNFEPITPMNQDEVRKAELDFVTSELDRFGGIDRLFASVPADYTTKVFDRFVELLNSGQYAAGTGNQGNPFEFSAAEISTMKTIVLSLASKLKTSIVKADLAIGKGPEGLLVESEVGYRMAGVLAKKLSEVVLGAEEGKDTLVEIEVPVPVDSKDKDKIKADSAAASEMKKVTLSLPKYIYPTEVRLAAAAILHKDRSESPDWALAERAQVNKAVQEAIVKKALAGVPFDQIKLEQLARPVVRWLIDNKKIAAAVAAGAETALSSF